MKVSINKITNAVDKVTALASDMKSVPGILLTLTKKDESENSGTLAVCFTDGHRSVIEKIDAEIESSDRLGSIAVEYTTFLRAIKNCTPSGMIKVSDVYIRFTTDGIINIEAEQYLQIMGDNGEVAGVKKMASAAMDVQWKEPGSDMKTSLLTRMKYDDIFDVDERDGSDGREARPAINVDEYDRKELVDALNKTSVEKGRQIYFSVKSQKIFVANQAHLTALPVTGYSIDQATKDEIRGELSLAGNDSEEAFNAAVASKVNRMHYSLAIPQVIAKALATILSKMTTDTVSLYVEGKFCNIFVNEDDEVVGIWFEMAQASKAHLGSFERYNSLGYDSYQIVFYNDFLSNSVRKALDSTSADKVELSFVENKDSDIDCPVTMLIKGGSASASTKDVYTIAPENLVDVNNDILGKTYKVSLRVLSDMLSQIKTDRVAVDFNVATDGSVCLRVAEIDNEAMKEQYIKARELTKQECEAAGRVFDPNTTPTSATARLKTCRDESVMLTRQYTMLG